MYKIDRLYGKPHRVQAFMNDFDKSSKGKLF